MPHTQFHQHVLKWFDKHGRKNLPWQLNQTPYHVWVSEIMLQQTQVNTVIPYFNRFIKNFPNLKKLSSTHIDDVLAHWSGLGYYARARNLHRTAQIIQQKFHGKFPDDSETLQTLPGIGRSTAGAILALSMQQRAAILDGNVKRVLCRYHAIEGSPINPKVNNQLWKFAEQYTPEKRVADYTQAMMDLGATLCTRTKPKCQECPLQKNCLGFAQGNPTDYPHKKISKKLPVRSIYLLMLQNQEGEILLEKRPPAGIWGGLWSLPECAKDEDIQQWCKQHYSCHTDQVNLWPEMRHTFSHFHLDIIPVLAKIQKWAPPLMESDKIVWYKASQANAKGLAAPVKKLLRKLIETL